MKDLYIRENERRKGLLKRRDARSVYPSPPFPRSEADFVSSKMMKIDVNKSGRIFDFLVSAGMLVLQYDPNQPPKAFENEDGHPMIQLGAELIDRPTLTEVKLNGGV